MTGTRVVDASAAVALLFGEPDGEAVGRALGGARLVAPALLEFEIANACAMKCRRYPDQRDALLAAFELRRRLGVETIAVDHAAAVALAMATGLTAYDASYLWLARRLGAEIVTLDRNLAEVARSRD